MEQQLNLNVVVPTRGEMRILNVLWELGQATVEEVISHPSFSTPPNYKTTQTILRIMEEKGLAGHETRGRVFVFVPCVTREQVARLSVQSFLQENFTGSVKDLMLGVIQTGKVCKSELEQLEMLIHNYRTQSESFAD
jgi:predicted transcriptional regulator